MNASVRVRGGAGQWWSLAVAAGGRHRLASSAPTGVVRALSRVSWSRTNSAPTHCSSAGACRVLRCRAASGEGRRMDLAVEDRVGFQDGQSVCGDEVSGEQNTVYPRYC
jgi:hypothetical protein